MKKILLAFDGAHFSEGAFEFVRRMTEMEPALVTGVFLPQVDYARLWSYTAGGIGGPLFIPLPDDSEAITRNKERFETLCRQNNIDYRVHRDFNDFALPELKKETWFADLLVIGSESFYENAGVGEPNEYLEETLHAVACPVVLVPEKFNFPDNSILAYDGSESSVFAIKQFAYLFPAFAKNETLLVYSDPHGDNSIPEQANIEELAARHFSNLTICKLTISTKKVFTSGLQQKQSAFLVSVSFGRSSLSLMFRKSYISGAIKEHKLPIFITHR
jgi:hypothetical protein